MHFYYSKAMCGICCLVCIHCAQQSPFKSPPKCQTLLNEALLPSLARRGPDVSKRADIPLKLGLNCHLRVCAYTLRMRGPSLIDELDTQPLSNARNQLFLWNGEIFSGLDVGLEECDTNVLYTALTACRSDDDVLRTIKSVKGPFAFMYLNNDDQSLWFGRDCFGRRSLLWSMTAGENGCKMMVLSSVADQPDNETAWQEVPAKGIFKLNLSSASTDVFDLCCYPWNPDLDLSGEIEESICHSDSRSEVIKLDDLTYQFGHESWRGLTLRVNVIRDSILIEPPVVPSLNRVLPTEGSLLPLIPPPSIEDNDSLETAAASLLTHVEFSRHVEDFLDSLREAVRRRLIGADAKTGVGILFSGGVDCSLLAAIADECLPNHVPIDLLNVAFQPLKGADEADLKTKKQKNQNQTDKKSDYDVPDRRTGLNGWTELKAMNGSRDWRFVAIDVPLEELMEEKRDRISKLIYPLRTILDDSIGCATWFAARGRGKLVGEDGSSGETPFESTARVLLLGSGADEQLGGYSRHRVRFSKDGWEALGDELKKDFDRISSRNLGRDDRIVADHGKESRLPYLDEDVAALLQQIPVHLKSDPRLPRGCGEKVLLRMAAWKMGLRKTAFEPKRAIQFGSRISKTEPTATKKIKASDLVS